MDSYSAGVGPLRSRHRSFALQRKSNNTSSGFVHPTQLATGDGITCALSVCRTILANCVINFFSYTLHNSRFVVAGCLFSHFSFVVQTKTRTFETHSIHFYNDAPSHTRKRKENDKHVLSDLDLVLCLIFAFLCQDPDSKFL